MGSFWNFRLLVILSSLSWEQSRECLVKHSCDWAPLTICLNLMRFVLWHCLFKPLSLWHFSQHPFALWLWVPKGGCGGTGCKRAGVMVGVTLLLVARLQSPGWKASWTGCYGDITNVKGEWSLEGTEHTHTLCPWCSRVNVSSRAESAVAMTMRDRNS